MTKFGTLYSYWNRKLDCSVSEYIEIIKKVSGIGFDLLEVNADHISHMSEEALKRMNNERNIQKLNFSITSGPSKEYDLASDDEITRGKNKIFFKDI